MTKADFIRRVAYENGVAQTAAEQWVNAIFRTLRNCVIDNPLVKISGFGKFEHKASPAGTITLPTGETVDVPVRMKLKFTPSKYVDGAIIDGISSMAFDDRMEKINALMRGEHVPGYRLYGDGRLVEVEEIDPLAPMDTSDE